MFTDNVPVFNFYKLRYRRSIYLKLAAPESHTFYTTYKRIDRLDQWGSDCIHHVFWYKLRAGVAYQETGCEPQLVLDFMSALVHSSLRVPFDWPSRKKEARQYLEKPDIIKNTDLETIQKLVTTFIRRDRFSGGHFEMSMFIWHLYENIEAPS